MATVAASMLARNAEAEGISPYVISSVSAPLKRRRKILCIGNSYTFYNDMPGMLVKIASSDPTNDIELGIQSVTKGNARLGELWQNTDFREVLQSRNWDIVVLQGFSLWAMSEATIKENTAAAVAWQRDIERVGARTVIYQTWAQQRGSHWYTTGEMKDLLRSPEHMQGVIDRETIKLADRINAKIIPVGDAWMVAANDFSLYNKDANHPNVVGSYLTALCFYHCLTSRSLKNVTYWPQELDEQRARELQAIAANQVYPRGWRNQQSSLVGSYAMAA